MEQISWTDFEKVEVRTGTILEVFDYPEARKPAYKVKVDFGEFGIKTVSYTHLDVYKRQLKG